MGVNALWQLLRAEGLVEHYQGSGAADHRQIVNDVDGLAVAVDMSVWCMQVGGSASNEGLVAQARVMRITPLHQGVAVTPDGRPPRARTAGRQPAGAAAALFGESMSRQALPCSRGRPSTLPPAARLAVRHRRAAACG